GLEKRLKDVGIPLERAKVGDRYVLEALHQNGWYFGGESSGHLLCLDCHTTGDGIIAALQVLTAVVRSGKTLRELTRELKMY
ncbi:phosphoglucosamine mutase, partial [Micrococcus luteus]|nr:phosphoglucosamine mutase [Micrococcus luteus]